MNSLHLISRPPIKSVQPDRQKAAKGLALGGRYSPSLLTNKSITGSTMQPQPENKAISANKTKWKELRKDFSHKSFPSSESSSPISNSSGDTKPSEKFVDDVEKRKSRKKRRKKGKKGKKNQYQTAISSEPGVSVEDHSQVGPVSETCHGNNVDHNDALVSTSETLETPLLDHVNSKCKDMLKVAIPVSKKSSENHSVGSIEKKPQPKDSVVAVCDGVKHMNSTHVRSFANSYYRNRNDRPHSSVLDSVPTHANSNYRYRTNYSQPPASSFRKGFFGCKNLSNDTVDLCNNANEIGHSCHSNSWELYSATANRRNTPNKMSPQFSSVNRFGGVGNLQGRVGKENTHTVWQKVQRNESSGDSKSAPKPLQLDVPVEETSFLDRNRDDFADAKQLKNADSKWENKGIAASNQECKLYPQSESHADIANSDGSLKVAGSLDENSSISSNVRDQNVMSSVTKSPQSESGSSNHSDMKSQMTGDPSHSLLKSGNSLDQSKVMEEQSAQFVPNHVSDSSEEEPENIPLADVGETSGADMQKWVTNGIEDCGSTKSAYSSSVEQSDNATSESKVGGDSESIVPGAEAGSINQTFKDTICSPHNGKCGGSLQLMDQQVNLLEEQKNSSALTRCPNTVARYQIVAEAADRIAEAVNRAYSLQLESEAIEKVYGWPLSEFERVLHYSSPVIYQPTNIVCHMCSKDQFGSVSLCRHEKPNVSLESLWNWYEDLGAYGLRVSGDDFENKKRVGEGCFKYAVYFIPYLSAIQLFKKCDNHSGDTNNSISNANHLPVSLELAPQPKGAASVQLAESTLSNDAELLFEFFESVQPPNRLPLFEQIKDLVSDGGVPQYRGHGDPTYLKSVKLDDLHPSSWYSVAWYPIYRIPEDTFRAAFLTYHSLGHLKRGSARFGSISVQDSVVCPAVGLQSYNTHNECWFNPQSSIPNHLKPACLDMNQSRVLKERLRTLEETAMLMATAVLTRGNLTSRNRQPDYEFFCSRKRY